jgi:hypothetical protein
MENPEKLATKGTQDEKTHNTICFEHHYAQTHTNNI